MSLDLDERQRAMLQEMDVHVWWPQAVAAPVPALSRAPALVPASATVPRAATAAAPPGAAKPAAPVSSPPDIATNNISTNVIGTRAASQLTPHILPADVAAMGWPALHQAVSGCTACKLCEGRKNTVFGVGQPQADDSAAPQVDWLIVGEAPGEEEDRTGEPFAGPAGKLLDNMLKAVGQARHRNVFMTNVIKCRPPGNRNPEAMEVAQCEPYLRRQIELLQPKIILAMGRHAINALLQTSVPDVHKLPPGKLRGQVHSYQSAGRSVPVVVTYHPATLLRNLPEKAKAWADLCLAMEAVKAGTDP